MTSPAGLDRGTVQAVQRRTVGTLSVTQMLSGIAVAGSLPAGALIAASLGGEGAAGLAQTAGVVGAALLALPLAQLALSHGRRVSLSTGYAIGALGAVVAVIGGAARVLPVVLLGSLLLGVSTAAGYQGRYAATDLADEDHRGRALSIVVWAGTIGAVLGPNLLQFSGSLALRVGLPQLTGPFLLAAAVLVAASSVLFLRLRPDPYLLARSLAAERDGDLGRSCLRDGIAHLRRHRRAVLGIAAVAIGHVVMIMVMVMPADDVVTLGIGLFLLGLGWSCTLIAGSTLLTDDAEPTERPSVQGLSDLVMNVAGAVGGAAAGLIVVEFSYGWLCAAAAVPVAVLLGLVAMPSMRSSAPAAPH